MKNFNSMDKILEAIDLLTTELSLLHDKINKLDFEDFAELRNACYSFEDLVEQLTELRWSLYNKHISSLYDKQAKKKLTDEEKKLIDEYDRIKDFEDKCLKADFNI